MMREAASWDAKEEKDIYALRSNELSKVQPSSLYGDDLIDYIVDYVSAKRDYSRNDIINISHVLRRISSPFFRRTRNRQNVYVQYNR